MAIPLSYNLRNLRLRKSLTIMTALGIALTVATAVFIMALLAGLGRAFGTHRRSSECADAAQRFGFGTRRGWRIARCCGSFEELAGSRQEQPGRASGFRGRHSGGGACRAKAEPAKPM